MLPYDQRVTASSSETPSQHCFLRLPFTLEGVHWRQYCSRLDGSEATDPSKRGPDGYLRSSQTHSIPRIRNARRERRSLTHADDRRRSSRILPKLLNLSAADWTMRRVFDLHGRLFVRLLRRFPDSPQRDIQRGCWRKRPLGPELGAEPGLSCDVR